MTQRTKAVFKTTKDTLYADNTSQLITESTHRTAFEDTADSAVFIDDEWVYAYKNPDAVRVATTANGTLSTAYINGATVDGITLATNDRILLKDQSTASENGIFYVNNSGAPTRVSDFNTTDTVKLGAMVYVSEGTANAKKTFKLTAPTGTITVGSSNLTFEDRLAAGYQPLDSELTAIAGLTSAADRVPYFTGSGTAALATFTTAGRALVDDASASAQRTTLGLGTIATQASSSVTITGGTINGTTIGATTPSSGVFEGDGTAALTLNRETSNGNILIFEKLGSQIGFFKAFDTYLDLRANTGLSLFLGGNNSQQLELNGSAALFTGTIGLTGTRVTHGYFTDITPTKINAGGAVTVATGDKVLIQDASDSDNLKTVTAQSIADLASTGLESLDISNGYVNNTTFCILAGGDVNAYTRTDNTTKYFSFAMPHYDNEDTPINLMYGIASSSENQLNIGGGGVGTGLTKIVFNTATSSTAAPGAGVDRLEIDENVIISSSADFIIESPSIPSSASDTGIKGQISYDSSYIYVCTATNTWKRIAIATW